MAKTRIIVPGCRDKKIRAIQSDTASSVLSAVGQIKTTRASHVDPGSFLQADALYVLGSDYADATDLGPEILEKWANHWFADMHPCGYAVVLGPYAPGDKASALAAEVAWLNARNIPLHPTPEDSYEILENRLDFELMSASAIRGLIGDDAPATLKQKAGDIVIHDLLRKSLLSARSRLTAITPPVETGDDTVSVTFHAVSYSGIAETGTAGFRFTDPTTAVLLYRNLSLD